MKVTFFSGGKPGHLFLENGVITSLHSSGAKETGMLKDLFSSTRGVSSREVEKWLSKIGCSKIEIVDDINGEKVDQFLTENGFYGSVLIRSRGEIALRKGYRFSDIRAQTLNHHENLFRCKGLSEIASCLVLSHLIENKVLELDDPLGKFFPSLILRWPHLSSITLEMLMHHTTGIADPESRSVPIDIDLTTPVILQHLLSRPLKFSPGSFVFHAKANHRILGAVMEEASGSRYEELVKSLSIENIYVTEKMQAVRQYNADGSEEKCDHTAFRTCADDLIATTTGLLALSYRWKPLFSQVKPYKVFGTGEVVVRGFGFDADFLFGKRSFSKMTDSGLVFTIPKDELEVAIITNKPLPEGVSLKKLISIITTNQL